MESLSHRALKRAALDWLLHEGCSAAAAEVLAPIPRWRVDAAGVAWSRDESRGAGPRREARTVIVECKAHRGDFLRERHDVDRLLRERRRLEAAIPDLERLAHAAEPWIDAAEPGEAPGPRRGRAWRRAMDDPRQGSLFPRRSVPLWRSRLPAVRETLRELRLLDERLYGGAKLCTMATYALADGLWVLACPGVVREGELPEGWGLLECRPGRGGPGAVVVRTPAKARPTSRAHRERLLRHVAVAATRQIVGASGGP